MSQGGAGQFPAGEELAGEDAVPALSPPRAVTTPAAILFNGAIFPYLPSGLLAPLDPVDQQAALALLVRFGTLASVPTLGSKFRQIRKVDRRTPAQVADMVNETLADLLARRAITLRSVKVETSRAAGRVLLAVEYLNLRLSPTRPRVVQVNLT